MCTVQHSRFYRKRIPINKARKQNVLTLGGDTIIKSCIKVNQSTIQSAATNNCRSGVNGDTYHNESIVKEGSQCPGCDNTQVDNTQSDTPIEINSDTDKTEQLAPVHIFDINRQNINDKFISALVVKHGWKNKYRG